MMDLLSVQHVRRRSPSLLAKAENLHTVQGIKQHPVRQRRSVSIFLQNMLPGVIKNLQRKARWAKIRQQQAARIKGEAVNPEYAGPSRPDYAGKEGLGGRKPFFWDGFADLGASPRVKKIRKPFFFRKKAPNSTESSASKKQDTELLQKTAGSFGASLITALGISLVGVFFFLSFHWKPLPAEAIAFPEDKSYQSPMASWAGLNQITDDGSDLIPLDLTAVFSWSGYRVKRGDSVSRIAQEFGLSMDSIIASNGITNTRRLQTGAVLKIPSMDGIPYSVKAGDSLAGISSAFRVPLEAILDANNMESAQIPEGTQIFIPGARMKTEELKLALGELFLYPINGRLTSPFGWRDDPISGLRRYHTAMDMAAPTGTPVKAAGDGKVATVGVNASLGKYIILSHGSNYQTLYAHLSVVSVSQGNQIRQGAKIGEVGSTGYSTGPHLHFGVFKNGRPVNPQEYLSP
jgi:murein DD-endopeptidase MepM/ murein hydrolase activator NlpD